jgi:asparagine synthase (glutamine-hydrolysing)
MCGIGGKLSFDARPDPGLADEMNAQMRHRGPDASGVYADGPALLAHRRLSILDLSEAGRQPMSNADGTVHIVFNGEIYNYKELRQRVDHYPYQSETDTEVLLHLYEEYGIDCLQYLRGMFAFAIWDETTEQLFVARDRLGQKPLFYRYENDTFWFGSTIRTLLADDAVSATPDLPALREYLTYQYVPSPKTGFAGIKQLRPAEYAVITEDGMSRERYWSVSFANQSSASASTLADRLYDELREATRLRMRSDVPVGAFLSGGIDSSIVTALMSDIATDPVQTYSIGFNEDSYDELDFASRIADEFETNHHEYTVTPDSMEVLPSLVEQYEMPYGDPSALPTYYVSQVAADDITVVLTGDAGDEMFAGYDRYTWDRIATILSKVPTPVTDTYRHIVERLPDGVTEGTPLQRGATAFEIAEQGGVEQYARFICHALGEVNDEIWDGPVPEDELQFLRSAFENADGPTRMDEITHVDIQTYLPEDLLVKVDRASMAHSLEVRSPFLDHEFVAFASSVPAKYKWRRGDKKWLLKRAFSDILPDEVLTREKQGFGVPVNEWFRGELRAYADEKLQRLGARDPFDASGLQQQFDSHVAGTENHGYRIWDRVMLEAWYERFIDSA